MKLTIITGLLKKVWAVIKPLLKSTVLEVLRDKQVLCLAEKWVEKATKLDLDGDGKFDWATEELQAELKQIGKKYSKASISLAVQAVYESLKSRGVVD